MGPIQEHIACASIEKCVDIVAHLTGLRSHRPHSYHKLALNISIKIKILKASFGTHSTFQYIVLCTNGINYLPSFTCMKHAHWWTWKTNPSGSKFTDQARISMIQRRYITLYYFEKFDKKVRTLSFRRKNEKRKSLLTHNCFWAMLNPFLHQIRTANSKTTQKSLTAHNFFYATLNLLSQNSFAIGLFQGASDAWNMSVAFISVILLPIVGNAAEHASAIMFAVKDKLDITLGVAIGSSTQISMFVIPFCVVVGWIMGKPMDLNFQLFETATLFVTVLVVAFMLQAIGLDPIGGHKINLHLEYSLTRQEGTSNYFKGLMLILCYLIVAASFFVHVDPTTVNFGISLHRNCPLVVMFVLSVQIGL
ncbi:Sodium/calcium exchanger membrane region [Dillenia turbinata]|uniref:Sodium/calcium exchanger membrane region n=1 Tax=Dillenia turbinata TaxID=194707 RepID=A0AAN8UPS2_9MAGN